MQKYIIALYIRLSLEDSKTDSMSIDSQRLILREYAMSLEEWDDAEVLEFIDNGHSGANFERPAVQNLLDMVREGKINCILVKDDCVNIELNSESLGNTGFCDVSSVF